MPEPALAPELAPMPELAPAPELVPMPELAPEAVSMSVGVRPPQAAAMTHIPSPAPIHVDTMESYPSSWHGRAAALLSRG